MLKSLKEFKKSSFQTKFFVLNAVIYGLALLITMLYCYGRLDFVRSGQPIFTNQEFPS